MKVIAICTGKLQAFSTKSGQTGYFKQPQSGPVRVTKDGVQGDEIADLKHHGGLDQAVYLFGDKDRQAWEARLNRSCPAGYFGENLLISELASADLYLGDLLTIGDVVLQITSPRIPCATYAAVTQDKTALKDFYAAKMPGAYARVLKGGSITADDTCIQVSYEGERISVVENMTAYHSNFTDQDFLRRALTVPAHHKLHLEAKARLAST